MLFRSEKCETRPAELILFSKKLSSIELFASTFAIFVHTKIGLRFGIVKSETRFPFASALTFRYLCEYEDRLRFGIVKSETRFSFVSALTFHYLCGAEGYRLSFS